MKLCYIADPVDPNTQRWLDYFVKRGHEVHLIVTKRTQENLEGVTIHDANPATKIKKVGFLTRIWRIKRIIKRIKPDIFHAHYVAYNGLLGALSGFQPLVLTAWGSDIYLDANKSRLDFLLTKYTLKRARLLTSESKDLLHRIEGIVGKNNSRMVNICWGIDFDKFHPGIGTEYLKKELNLEDSPVVFSPRKFNPIYNIDTIILAIPSVLKEVPNAKFILKNHLGIQEKELKNLAKLLGVMESCRFIGEKSYDEMATFYNVSDVVVSVPSSDSISNCVLEAMACAAPVIATDLPTTREWIVNEVNGLLVSPRDSEGLARAIVKILNNRFLKDKFITHNLSMVREKADYFKEMQKVENLYKALM